MLGLLCLCLGGCVYFRARARRLTTVSLVCMRARARPLYLSNLLLLLLRTHWAAPTTSQFSFVWLLVNANEFSDSLARALLVRAHCLPASRVSVAAAAAAVAVVVVGASREQKSEALATSAYERERVRAPMRTGIALVARARALKRPSAALRWPQSAKAAAAHNFRLVRVRCSNRAPPTSGDERAQSCCGSLAPALRGKFTCCARAR